jgi:hypothetical protein
LILVIIFGIVHFDNTAEATISVDSNDSKDAIEYNRDVFNISNNTGHSEEPQIMKSGNNIYVLWIDDSSGSRDVYFKKSSDNGCTFNRATNLGIGEGGSLDPKMAISKENIYIIWEQTPGNNGAIFFTRSSDNGASFETVKNLGNNTGFNGFPQIAASGNNVYVVWHDASKGINFARSTDSGASFETVKNLGNNTGFNGFPQIATIGNNVYVMWTNNFQEKYGQVYFTRSTDSGASFGTPITLESKDDDVGTMVFSPHITANPNNDDVYLVWHGGRIVEHSYVEALISDVYFTRSTDSGASFGETTNLSNYSGWSVDPQIAVSEDNNVYVVWTNNFQEKYGQIYFTRSTDSGASFGETTNLSNYSGWSVDPQIAVSEDNNVYVVWTNNATGNEETLFKNKINDDMTCINLNLGIEPENLDVEKKINARQRAVDIAIVQATFTEAAYDKSFYMFYETYKAEENKTSTSPNTTKYTDLLLSKLDQDPKTWSALIQIADHLKWLTPKSSIDILTDKDVHSGTLLFSNNGTNLYDVIMLEHQEYVTQQEYNNLKKFVSNGGLLFLLNGNVFYGEVEYQNNTDTIRLVKGHGIASNGETAWKSVKERWKEETSEWTGGNYKCCFKWEFIFRNDPFGITHVEEHYITNPKAKILLDYNVTINRPDPGQFVIATYEIEYKKGKVITLGIWTVNKLFENDRFLRFFDSLLYQYALRE